MRAGFKILVAQPALAAFGHNQFLIGQHHVAQQLAGRVVKHQRATRHSHNHGLTVGAVATFGKPLLTIGREKMSLISKRKQRVQVRVGHDCDGAAVAAITAVWTGLGIGFLVAHVARAIAALARSHHDLRTINKHVSSIRP